MEKNQCILIGRRAARKQRSTFPFFGTQSMPKVNDHNEDGDYADDAEDNVYDKGDVLMMILIMMMMMIITNMGIMMTMMIMIMIMVAMMVLMMIDSMMMNP